MRRCMAAKKVVAPLLQQPLTTHRDRVSAFNGAVTLSAGSPTLLLLLLKQLPLLPFFQLQATPQFNAHSKE